jgi:hypothetical protein
MERCLVVERKSGSARGTRGGRRHTHQHQRKAADAPSTITTTTTTTTTAITTTTTTTTTTITTLSPWRLKGRRLASGRRLRCKPHRVGPARCPLECQRARRATGWAADRPPHIHCCRRKSQQQYLQWQRCLRQPKSKEGQRCWRLRGHTQQRHHQHYHQHHVHTTHYHHHRQH